MKKFNDIPDMGYYWFYEYGHEPRIVQIKGPHAEFKSFDGSMQAWIKPMDFFIGPIAEPSAELIFVLKEE